MLFTSLEFIFIFLPAVVIVYFILSRFASFTSAKIWLIVSSLFFYGYYSKAYIPILLGSIFLNFLAGTFLQKRQQENSLPDKPLPDKVLFFTAIAANLILLGYFKYANFFLETINHVTDARFAPIEMTLPLAISFYTFQQISFLADSYTRKTTGSKCIDYCFFVLFFPQLIAGPILRYAEIIPQFIKKVHDLDWRNIALGFFVFTAGLFKKVVIADSFAVWAKTELGPDYSIGFLDSWIVSLSYTFQLYYDFSAYSDMAIGAALMFNLRLPVNFDSPYRAQNIQDFWRRWHITLSRWLRDYLYIPLGGNRKGANRTLLNILITFLLGGVWHGAGWTFIIWGGLHGTALAANRVWKNMGLGMNAFWGWVTTFLFINFSWVFFHAASIKEAIAVVKGMLGLNGHLSLPGEIALYYEKWKSLTISNPEDMPIFSLILFSTAVFIMPNTMQMINFVPYNGLFTFKTDLKNAVILGIIFFLAMMTFVGEAGQSDFIYFQF